MNKETIENLTKQCGDAFYTLESEQFRRNYAELKEAFQTIYPHFNIAYSYKTNYTPRLCEIVNELGGYAEVVSDMELEIAQRIGVEPRKIIWNGPYKNAAKAEQLLLAGGSINIDSRCETEIVKQIAEKRAGHTLNVGIRCNFDIGDSVLSRFGFDIESDDFREAIGLFHRYKNLHLIGLQCHFATRRLDTWRPRAVKMLALADRLGIVPERIDLGGGLFGKMGASLQAQFDARIPTYHEYAKAIASVFAEHYHGRDEKPELIVEPGTALVGDCMRFAAKVVSIKTVRGKAIATLLGSIYNINPTLNTKNPPIEIVSMGQKQNTYSDLDFGGFTCIESDYLYRHFNGKLAVGDYVVFSNVGSYSIVLKPPFILPNFPVIDISNGRVDLIKRAENFDDVFHTFSFPPKK